RRARQVLAQAGSREAVRVSPATVFEVAALHTLGRLHLARPLEQWIREALDGAGIRGGELTPTLPPAGGAIPRPPPPDPLDRLLVATARALQATFLTSDARILDYAAKTR